MGALQQPGELMEQNLLRWAVGMGLAVPPNCIPARSQDEWPARSDAGEGGTKLQHRDAMAVFDNMYPFQEHYDYGALPTKMSDWNETLSLDSSKHEQGHGFHQRAKIRREIKDKIKAGNGDIITWSSVG